MDKESFTIVDPVEVQHESDMCREAAKLVKADEGGAALVIMEAFRVYIRQVADYELSQQGILAFVQWLDRGGNLGDPDMAKITPLGDA